MTQRRLKDQIEAYLERRSQHYDFAVNVDREYLYKFIRFTSAHDVTEITKEDMEKFRDYIWSFYSSKHYRNMAEKSVRCLLKHYHARGYPVSDFYLKI